ncbi:MAG: response regulator [Nitrospira sp.]|nr:response regulator [Nitrospira sp.]
MKRVVVIDDEPFILMMIEDKLKNAGIQVTTIRDSKQAMGAIKKERPDLVITDWMMPDLSGIELCRMLKSDPDVKDIPVFMLTAMGQNPEEQLGTQSGVEKYLTKPFSPNLLLKMVLDVIGKV